MTVYFFAAINRQDMSIYAQYEAAGFSSIEKFGVEVLAVCDDPRAIETEAAGERIILLRFPDQAALDAWYGSPEYQAAIPLRRASAQTTSLFSFEGLTAYPGSRRDHP